MPNDSSTLGVPKTGLAGFLQNAKHDVVSGFLVFLIALPLCLAISLACGYPAIAGIFTAIIGSILATFISNSELTIKGPAAGLIVIALGCVTDFGFTGGKDLGADMQAYRMALAVGVAAGVIQIGFGLFRTGILGEFFPTSAVHGMLAAIGVIIIAKQVPVAMGVSGKGEPLELLVQIPQEILHMNPEIACIGFTSLLILFGMPLIKNKYVRLIPAPLVVVLVAVPMGMYFNLSHEHTYSLLGHQYKLGEQFLVTVPDNMFKAITFPDFSALQEPVAWKWVLMFALIGSLESLLSAKAVDLLDPWKRKTNLNRDLLAVGVGNTVAAMVGGLPMISEIVRSRANIDNGARSRFADMFHGIFLLLFVALLPGLIHRIPLAALGAMLVYTGFRLASPREFVKTLNVGREQLVIFVSTIVGVLATDLLAGIGIGIGVKLLIHYINGVPLASFFKPYLNIEPRGKHTFAVLVSHSAVFSNWIMFKRQIEDVGLKQGNNIILDMSDTRLVDHTVMEKLHELEREFTEQQLKLEIIGLEEHLQFSPHPHAARRKAPMTAVTQ
jgi:MFS superfamily sulfate permease-like transporter